MNQQQEQPAQDSAAEKIEWNKPVLERLSMRATETSSVDFRFNDGVNSYS